jgi:hypothetical protein
MGGEGRCGFCIFLVGDWDQEFGEGRALAGMAARLGRWRGLAWGAPGVRFPTSGEGDAIWEHSEWKLAGIVGHVLWRCRLDFGIQQSGFGGAHGIGDSCAATTIACLWHCGGVPPGELEGGAAWGTWMEVCATAQRFLYLLLYVLLAYSL